MHFIYPGDPIRLGGPEVPPCCGLPMSSHQVTRHGPSRDYLCRHIRDTGIDLYDGATKHHVCDLRHAQESAKNAGIACKTKQGSVHLMHGRQSRQRLLLTRHGPSSPTAEKDDKILARSSQVLPPHTPRPPTLGGNKGYLKSLAIQVLFLDSNHPIYIYKCPG